MSSFAKEKTYYEPYVSDKFKNNKKNEYEFKNNEEKETYPTFNALIEKLGLKLYNDETEDDEIEIKGRDAIVKIYSKDGQKYAVRTKKNCPILGEENSEDAIQDMKIWVKVLFQMP